MSLSPSVPAASADALALSANPAPHTLRMPLLLLGAGLVVAVCLAYFPLPILSYYKEWTFAMLLALAALVLPAGPALRRGWPAETVLAGGLSVVLLRQALVGDGLWPQAALSAGYLLFFVLAHRLGRHMARSSLTRCAGWLGGAIVLACLGNSFLTVGQMQGWDTGGWPLIAARSGPRLGGNLAQVNHTATLLWIGVIAAVGLSQARVLNAGVSLALTALFGLFLIATGSRMPLVVALGLFVGAAAIRWRTNDPDVKRGAVALMAVAAGLPALELGWNLLGMPELLGLSSGGRRLANDGGSGEIRRWLLSAAWDAAKLEPWWGVGVGRYVHHTYELAVATGRSVAHGAELHAHNLVAHTAAELGLPAALGVVIALGAVLRRAWRCALSSLPGLMLAAVVVAILVHALLEYPLSYAYFLGPLAWVLGALFELQAVSGMTPATGHAPAQGLAGSEPPSGWLTSRRSLQVLAGSVLVLCLASHRLHAPLERAMQEIVFQVSMGAVIQMQPEVAQALEEVADWSPYRDHAAAARLIATVPSAETAADLSARCERSLLFGATPFLLSRCAVANQLAGHARRATELATSQCVMYPDTAYLLFQLLTVIGPRYPAVLGLQAPCISIAHAPAS